MRKMGPVLVAGLLLACAVPPERGLAQSSGMPKPPEALLKMRAAFAEAALAGDAEAAAKLSRFPLDNPASQGGKSLSRVAFLKRFKDDFTRRQDIVYCWQNHNLEMEYRNGASNFGVWHLDCGTNVYTFVLTGIHWFYTGYETHK